MRRACASVCMLAALSVALPARAHVADLYNSVHFHSGHVDFGTPPRRARVGECDDRRVEEGAMDPVDRVGVELEDQAAGADKRARLLASRLMQASRECGAGRWNAALAGYRWAGEHYGWWGNLRDRAEVLGEMQALRQPAPALAPALRAYLRAMDLYDVRDLAGARPLFETAYASRAPGFLRAHALYQLASLAYEAHDLVTAATGYQRCMREFPNGPKREAGLLMLARCTLLLSAPTVHELAVGSNAVARLLREYPGTRFRRAAKGLRARALYLTGRHREAAVIYLALDDLPSVETVAAAMSPAQRAALRVRLLAAYLERLGRASTLEQYTRAVHDVARTRDALGPAEALRFAGLLERRATLLAWYLYYRLYHCENKPIDLARMAALADRAVRRHGPGSLPPLVLVRLGELCYQRHQFARALSWADRALAAGPYDRALFVRGACLAKLHRPAAAIGPLRELLSGFPASPLLRAAREELAICCEATGDLPAALDLYFDLGYQADIAFLLDARVSLAQAQDYLRRFPDRDYRDIAFEEWRGYRRAPFPPCRTHALVRYSVGIRLTRQERWDEAARWLRQVPRADYHLFGREPIDREYGSLRADPLTVIRELGRLKRGAARAPEGSRRAEALYRYASYYYTHSQLLLYDYGLWKGNRAISVGTWWNPKVAAPADAAAVRRHMYEHEVYARAMAICQDIARRYPRSPSAPRALYRAACCAYRLGAFSTWWREEDEKRAHLSALSSALMQRVADRYPRDALAGEARKFAGVFREEAREGRW